MRTDYKDFKYLDFHDSYFSKVEVNVHSMVWVLEAVNISSECVLNPYSCSMMASKMKVEFTDYNVSDCNFDFFRLAEESFDIIDVNEISVTDEKYTYLFCMRQGGGDYTELRISFSNITFEWEKYVAKAWYVYSEEKNCVKKFILDNPYTDWMVLDSRHGSEMTIELQSELSESHRLYGIEAMAYAKYRVK